jgi:transposase
VAQRDAKANRLKAQGLLNAHPERVRAAHFLSGEFFDARDLLQVKYEMLRQAQIGGDAKSEAATMFGLSRPTFYQAEAAFNKEGLNGLLPRQRGPKGAHKLTAAVMSYIKSRVQTGAPMHARALALEIKEELGLAIHPRSIERALARKKNPDIRTGSPLGAGSASWAKWVLGI